MRPTRICLINQKGGCGKSSTCFHLAGHLAQSGQRVLLVDADPQGSLSQGFFGPCLVESLEPQKTLAAVFANAVFHSPQALCSLASQENVTLLCANQHLAAHNTPCPETTGMKQFALAGCLDRLPQYDWVLIDCPPNLYQCSWNALLAADYVIIPVPPEDFGTQGLRAVHQAVANARLLNPRLRLLGHLVTRYDGRLLVHQTYEKRLRRLYSESVLLTVIPEASAFKVSLACRQPVANYAPRSKAADAIRQLSAELAERIDAGRDEARTA